MNKNIILMIIGLIALVTIIIIGYYAWSASANGGLPPIGGNGGSSSGGGGQTPVTKQEQINSMLKAQQGLQTAMNGLKSKKQTLQRLIKAGVSGGSKKQYQAQIIIIDKQLVQLQARYDAIGQQIAALQA